jgi:hypothetical protein
MKTLSFDHDGREAHLTLVEIDPVGIPRYRLVAEPSAENWRKGWHRRGNPEPYCEFTVIYRETGEPYILSYSGELWLTAWPEFFFQAGDEYAPRLTDVGQGLLKRLAREGL